MQEIKNMISTLKKYNYKQQFRPGLASVFINASYFTKKGIYRGIKRNAGELNGKLLDFGCGNKPYKDLFDVSEYIGIDIENEAHDHSQEPVDVFYDGKRIPFENGHFDNVFSSEVFEHVFNLDEMIEEISRVLRKDGKLLITLPFVWIEHEKPNDFARYTRFGIAHLLQKHGFEIEKSERSSTFIETIAQLASAYIYNTFIPSPTVLRWPLTILLIAPVNILGSILSFVLPDNKDLFLNHIIIARKKS